MWASCYGAWALEETWTAPEVIARQKGGEFSYPYIFEKQPGELWVITRRNLRTLIKPGEVPPLRVSLQESDFVG